MHTAVLHRPVLLEKNSATEKLYTFQQEQGRVTVWYIHMKATFKSLLPSNDKGANALSLMTWSIMYQLAIVVNVSTFASSSKNT